MAVFKLERIFQDLFRWIPCLVEQKEKQAMIQCFKRRSFGELKRI